MAETRESCVVCSGHGFPNEPCPECGHRIDTPRERTVAAEQLKSLQVYVAICECNAVLSASWPATSDFPLDRLNCRECGAQVPAHLVGIPYRGYGVDQTHACAICGGGVLLSEAAYVVVRASPSGTDEAPAHRSCAEARP